MLRYTRELSWSARSSTGKSTGLRSQRLGVRVPSGASFFIFFTFFTLKIYALSILNNYTIVIDPGHGGEDKGACNKKIVEKEIRLEIIIPK